MISVSKLTKTYGHSTALQDISFDIQSGEVVGFLGPNGAGKTTTMRILTGYIAATSGTVTIDTQKINEHAQHVRTKIGYLPESNPLYDSVRVYEYLEYIAGTKSIQHATDEIRRVVSICGLQQKIDALISELSKGYRQRVGLAAALLGNPDILLLDEPTSGLDPNQAAEIRQVIREIGKTKTILFSTHILQEVQAACDRAIIIHQGKIVAQGTVDELVHGSKGQSQVRVMIESPKESIAVELKALEGVQELTNLKNNEYLLTTTSQSDIRRSIFQLCVHKGWVLLEMERSTQSLEDVFRQLTTQS